MSTVQSPVTNGTVK